MEGILCVILDLAFRANLIMVNRIKNQSKVSGTTSRTKIVKTVIENVLSF